MSEKNANIAEEKFASGKSHATQAAQEFKEAAAVKAGELREALSAKAEEVRGSVTAKAGEVRQTVTTKAEEYREKANKVWADTSVKARSLQDDGEAYIRENPLRAVGIALGIGFALGLIFRR